MSHGQSLQPATGYLISNCLCVSRSCLLLFVSVSVSVFLATAVVNLV